MCDLGVHVAAPVAVAVATVGMLATRTMHPPAAATALFGVIGPESLHALGLMYAITPGLTGSAVLVGVALVINNMRGRYPQFWV